MIVVVFRVVGDVYDVREDCEHWAALTSWKPFYTHPSSQKFICKVKHEFVRLASNSHLSQIKLIFVGLPPALSANSCLQQKLFFVVKIIFETVIHKSSIVILELFLSNLDSVE